MVKHCISLREVWTYNLLISQVTKEEQVGELGAGNIPALLGLTECRAGNTLSTVKDIPMFEGVKYVSEPLLSSLQLNQNILKIYQNLLKF